MSTSQTLDSAAEATENALVGALHRDLRGQDTVAIAFSGGLDSTILAALCAQYMDGETWLVAVGAPGSRDVQRARRQARFLDLPLIEVSVAAQALARDLPEIVKLVGRTPMGPALAERLGVSPETMRVSPVLTGVQSALYYAFREGSKVARRVILGQGADELFAGYARYEGLRSQDLRARMKLDLASLEEVARPVEARVAAHHGVDPRYPYLEGGVKRAAQKLPKRLLVEGGARKRVLRRVADRLGLPTDVVNVPKTAAQYGSGLQALLKAAARQAGLPQHDFLESMLPPVQQPNPGSI